MVDLFQTTIIVSILAATVRIATPLLLAALGELVSERAGILNLGVEGNMLMSAFSGFIITYISGSLWIGLLAAVLAGAVMNLLMVFMATTLTVTPRPSGIIIQRYGWAPSRIRSCSDFGGICSIFTCRRRLFWIRISMSCTSSAT